MDVANSLELDSKIIGQAYRSDSPLCRSLRPGLTRKAPVCVGGRGMNDVLRLVHEAHRAGVVEVHIDGRMAE